MTIEAAVRTLGEKIGPLGRVIFASRHPPLIREQDEAINAIGYAKPRPNRTDEAP